MKIETGKGTISLMTLLSVWSISLVVNLPGLAVSPVLGKLDTIFPHTSQLEIQLLTILPNLFIIPFVLLSGRLSLSKNKISIVVVALIIYMCSGLAYLWANSMQALIVISCFLGMGCGLLIPLAAGLIADVFTGKYRMQQLGIKSGIANLSLIIATLLVGWLGNDNWHYPFLVYLIPIIPLLLSPFLHAVKQDMNGDDDASTPSQELNITSEKVVNGFFLWRILGIMGLYFFICYSTVIISYYLPFLMQDEKINSSALGTVTAIFFLAIFLPGFILPLVIRFFKQWTSLFSVICIAVGLLLMTVVHDVWFMALAAFFMGSGYGILQPIIYDKATFTVTRQSRATLALSFVLAVNYLSITVTPFIIDFFRDIMGTKSNLFPFWFNCILTAFFAVLTFLGRKSFVFKMDEQYYK